MIRKPVKWLALAGIAALYVIVKLFFLPDADKTAVHDAIAARLDTVVAAVADNSGSADPSKTTVTALVKALIDKQDAETWCLNPLKIKSVQTNEPITLTALGRVMQSNGQSAGTIPVDAFPLVFAEEAFIKWNDHDAYVMEMLIGGKYIAVHEGGYEHSVAGQGTPGDIYDPKDDDQVDSIIDAIREKGAVVDLTAKGRAAGVWDPESGFCLAGYWELNEVTGWTSPAADNEGRIVTHIKATATFHPTTLGAAKDAINPMGFSYTTVEQEYVAAKFNDGWRITSDK